MIEFFSGIGGMRYAIEDALEIGSQQNKKKQLVSCTAYEISLYANQTYSLNFGEPISSFKDDKRMEGSIRCKRQEKSDTCNKSNSSSPDKKKRKQFAIYTKLIEQLKPEDVQDVDIWTMSPPCQPFTNTRHAKQRDSADERCKGFKAIITLLRNIESETNRPRWILLENVKGFHGSDMLQEWYQCLKDCGYTWEEYLLSPTQFEIPNNRTRYYMVAERSSRFECGASSNDDECRTCIPSGNRNTPEPTITRPLSDYINNLEEKDDCIAQYLIHDKIFEAAWAKDLPIVCPLDRITHCFTAGYGRQIHRSTGSLLLINSDRERSVADEPIDRTNMSLYKGKLRRFTENEIATIFGFPSHFSFPEQLSLEHRYKLIGNSVNVRVISSLLQYLLFDEVFDKTM